MTEQRINAGAAHVFPAGTLNDTLQLENRHNVAGTVQYQIAAGMVINVPIVANADHTINNIHGQQVTVTNLLPNSLYCVY